MTTKLILLSVVCLVSIGLATCQTKGEKDKCEPRDDCSGHTTGCDSEGKKSCKPGWKGENCIERDVPVPTTCKEGDVIKLFCTDGTCFNNTCCCPNTRSGQFCLTGENVDDPCDPDPCNGQFCIRAGHAEGVDFWCDKPYTPTTPPIVIDGERRNSAVYLLVVVCGLLALVV